MTIYLPRIPTAPNEETYCRLRVTTQLPLPMALAFFLLIQLIILVVVDLRFALLCILVCRPINQSISQSISNSSLPLYTFPHKKKLELQREEVKNKQGRTLTVVRLAQRGSSAAYVERAAGCCCWAEKKRGRSRAESESGEEGHCLSMAGMRVSNGMGALSVCIVIRRREEVSPRRHLTPGWVL